MLLTCRVAVRFCGDVCLDQRLARINLMQLRLLTLLWGISSCSLGSSHTDLFSLNFLNPVNCVPFSGLSYLILSWLRWQLKPLLLEAAFSDCHRNYLLSSSLSPLPDCKSLEVRS